jgi:hypothetical protein
MPTRLTPRGALWDCMVSASRPTCGHAVHFAVSAFFRCRGDVSKSTTIEIRDISFPRAAADLSVIRSPDHDEATNDAFRFRRMCICAADRGFHCRRPMTTKRPAIGRLSTAGFSILPHLDVLFNITATSPREHLAFSCLSHGGPVGRRSRAAVWRMQLEQSVTVQNEA